MNRPNTKYYLNKFKSNKDISVLNVNSNVGSEGLTLVEASNVIFLNEWWDPKSEIVLRTVNRIGQNMVTHIKGQKYYR